MQRRSVELMANHDVSHVQQGHISFGVKKPDGDALLDSRSVSTRRTKSRLPPADSRGAGARRCREKFLRFFPEGFQDQTYLDWERGYKISAHEKWTELLNRATYRTLMQQRNFTEIAARAVRIESRTNLLFSFEKMALRDAVKSPAGARLFATGLYKFLHGRGVIKNKFQRWCEVIGALPRKQTRVLTWPLVTVFGFIAQPETHIVFETKDHTHCCSGV
jgi:hypothetical protein